MTEQVKQVEKEDKKTMAIARAGYWDIPLSAIKKFENEQKSAAARAEFMRQNSKQIGDIMKTKW